MQAAAVVAGCFGFYIAKNSILQTNAGITYVLQNSLTGELKVFDTPGIHFRVPFVSNVTSYKQVMTASFGAGQGAGPSSFGFNDTDPVRVLAAFVACISTAFSPSVRLPGDRSGFVPGNESDLHDVTRRHDAE